MSKHHTIGGKGRAAKDRPPKPTYANIKCQCGIVHPVTITEGTQLLIVPCDCGAVVRWYPEKVTIEEVTK